jgi:hypothetical protein
MLFPEQYFSIARDKLLALLNHRIEAEANLFPYNDIVKEMIKAIDYFIASNVRFREN